MKKISKMLSMWEFPSNKFIKERNFVLTMIRDVVDNEDFKKTCANTDN